MYNPILPFGGFGATAQPGALQNGIVKVNGMEGAKTYPMYANTMMPLFDANEDVFYLKTVDAYGVQSIRTFKFQELIEKEQTAQYVTVDEFNKFKEEMLNGKQHIRKQWNGSKPSKQYTANSNNDANSERFSEPKPDSSNAVVAEP